MPWQPLRNCTSEILTASLSVFLHEPFPQALSLFLSLRGCGQLHVTLSLEHFFALPMEKNIH